ncbi:putative tyrosinase-like protein tyr-3 [Argopecten irradians]|uniref:putative tyrosinase-like protein tyr-3 n=1 Tax=Argopecten irradians TaxID=31199 RepID=UPI00371CBE54
MLVSINPNLAWTVAISLSMASAAFIRPVIYPNGTIGVDVIQTGDRIVIPGDSNNPEEDEIDMGAFEFPLTKEDIAWLSSLLHLPEKGEIRTRKEYRVLTDTERQEFHLALNILKNDTSVSLNKYDLLANIHSRSSANKAAHAGPGFLGWHRVFLLMIENALRQACPNVTVPYWDVTLDQRLDKPYESVIWSKDFLGSGHGLVTDGPFNQWGTPFGFGHLQRLIAAQGRLMADSDVKKILSLRKLGDISYFSASADSNLEALHNRVHVWVGGQMRKIEIGAFDPTFYILHSFVDKIWEDFRSIQRREGIDPQKDYPQFYGRTGHAPLAPLGLGSLVVLDGISDIWGQRVQYRPQPTCKDTTSNLVCGSPYLRCNSEYKCVSVYKTEASALTFTSDHRKSPTNHYNNTMNWENTTTFTSAPNYSPSIDSTTTSSVVNPDSTSQRSINKTARSYLSYLTIYNMYIHRFNISSHQTSI